MNVIFSTRAYASVMAETTEKIKTETGGLFLGAYADDTWYIVEAIDPGPKAVFEVAYFEYDQAYTQHLIRKIANLYETELHLIGLWHRHPGSFDIFSSTDDGTNAKYAQLNSPGAISALVNIDPNFRITMYHVNRPCKYTKIDYEVGDDLIPANLFKFKTPEHFESLMNKFLRTKDVVVAKENEHHKSVSFSFFLKTIAPYLQEHICESIIAEPDMDEKAVRARMIDELIDDISYLSDDVGAEITVLQREKYIVLVQEAVEGITRLYFAYAEKEDKVIFEHNGKSYYYQSGLFKKLFEKALEAKKREKESSAVIPGQSEITADRHGRSNIIKLFFNEKDGGSNNGRH